MGFPLRLCAFARKVSTRIEEAGYSRAGGLDTEMIVRERRRKTSARRAIEKSDLNQVGFDDLLDRIFLFVN